MEWLNETLPYLKLPWEASEDELRACLRDGTVLCSLLNQLSPGSMRMVLVNFHDHLAYISFVLKAFSYVSFFTNLSAARLTLFGYSIGRQL